MDALERHLAVVRRGLDEDATELALALLELPLAGDDRDRVVRAIRHLTDLDSTDADDAERLRTVLGVPPTRPSPRPRPPSLSDVAGLDADGLAGLMRLSVVGDRPAGAVLDTLVHLPPSRLLGATARLLDDLPLVLRVLRAIADELRRHAVDRSFGAPSVTRSTTPPSDETRDAVGDLHDVIHESVTKGYPSPRGRNHGAQPPGAPPPVAAMPRVDDMEAAAPDDHHEQGAADVPRSSHTGDPAHPDGAAAREPPAGETNPAWPVVDCDDVVAPGRPFELVVGLGPDPDPRVVSVTGEVRLPDRPSVDLDVAVLADGFLLLPATDGGSAWQHRLTVDADHPHPTATLTLVALVDDDLRDERTIGVSFAVDGGVVGMASRTVLVGDPATDDAPLPSDDGPTAFGLPRSGPGTGAAHPDLTIEVRHGDDVAGRRLVFDVWSPLVDLPGPPLESAERVAVLGDDPAQLLRDLRSRPRNTEQPLARLDRIRGVGDAIARVLPAFVQDAVAAVRDARADNAAPTLLLLTEDAHVPFELATFHDADGTPWMLGQRFAVARWPVGPAPPQASPPRTVEIATAATIRADYVGVPKWDPLPATVDEVADVARRVPDTTAVEPTYDAVRRLLRDGEPQADLVHVALHGEHDLDGVEGGLVLLTDPPEPPAVPKVQMLHGDQVAGWRFGEGRAPLVFLNACQAGATGASLGAADGLPIALLRAGAAAVVAPMWNVDDVHSAVSATAFYAAAAEPVSCAEALRRRRAAVTDETVRRDGHAALSDLAYRLLGAPGLELVFVSTIGDDGTPATVGDGTTGRTGT